MDIELIIELIYIILLWMAFLRLSVIFANSKIDSSRYIKFASTLKAFKIRNSVLTQTKYIHIRVGGKNIVLVDKKQLYKSSPDEELKYYKTTMFVYGIIIAHIGFLIVDTE